MPKPLFFELEAPKRNRITEVMLEEFANYSFNESSTNRIVKEAGISKGSLFKYFDNKEDIYFYLVDSILQDFIEASQGYVTELPKGLYDRVLKYAEMEFDWYIKNPVAYTLMKKAFVKSDSEIYKKTEERYAVQGEALYYSLFDDVQDGRNKVDHKMQIDILKWMLQGFNDSYIQQLEATDDLELMKEQYLDELAAYLVVLKKGF